MDEKIQSPHITVGNTRAETLRLGVRGFNIVRVAGFEYFVHLLYGLPVYDIAVLALAYTLPYST